MSFSNWPKKMDDVAEKITTLFDKPRTLPPRCSIRRIWRLRGNFADEAKEAGSTDHGTITVSYTSDDPSKPEYIDEFDLDIENAGLWPVADAGPDALNDKLQTGRPATRMSVPEPDPFDFEGVDIGDGAILAGEPMPEPSGYLSAGVYSRDEPNRSARRTWQRLASPGGMIWIAEALGVPKETLRRAVAHVRAEPEKRRRCGIIRRHIPWETTAPLTNKHARRPKPRSLAR